MDQLKEIPSKVKKKRLRKIENSDPFTDYSPMINIPEQYEHELEEQHPQDQSPAMVHNENIAVIS